MYREPHSSESVYEFRRSSPEDACNAAIWIALNSDENNLVTHMTTLIVDVKAMVEDQQAALVKWPPEEPEAPQGSADVPEL